MIKSKRLAYDGRGNAVAKSEEELSSVISGNIYIQNLIDMSFHMELDLIDLNFLCNFSFIQLMKNSS